MIRGTIVGGERAVERFERMPQRLRDELRIGVGRAVLLVQRETKEDKLSGQVLNVRTGRLRRSINTRVDDSADRVVGTVGTNVEYAAAHEYGFAGTVSVREHLRQTVNGFTTVRAHSRNVVVPERSFLRSALADMAEPIRSEFEQAAQRALR
jgi:phage gpG-like protein